MNIKSDFKSTLIIISIVAVFAVGISLYFALQNHNENTQGPPTGQLPPANDQIKAQRESMAAIVKNWSAIQQTIPQKPVLGSTAWSEPQSFQFIGNNKVLAEFEDGHIAFAAVFDYSNPLQPLLVKVIDNYDFPFSETEWKSIVDEYGSAGYPIRTYAKSVFRGKNIVTFNDLTEIPENIFVLDSSENTNGTSSKSSSAIEETNIVIDEKGNLSAFRVAVALLDTANIYEGKQVACDTVYLKEITWATSTPQTINDALRALFALNDEHIGDLFNMVARVNKTLKFDKVVLVNGVAKVYLTGSFPNYSYLGGICDDPRLKTQIDETVLQFPAVKSVEIYLNGTIIPWQAMWSQKG